MANYQEVKVKSFKLKKEAKEYLHNFKEKNNLGDEKYKVETNFKPGDPLPWEAVILRKV